MFPQMRRKKQELSYEECLDILKRNTGGVLAVSGNDDYPYAVPMNYVYHDNIIYFHCAKTGHKIEGIMRNPKVSFSVIDQDEIVPEDFTTLYRSVIAFGKAIILADPAEKRAALELLNNKYSPDYAEKGEEEIRKFLDIVCIIALEIEHLTGKCGSELVGN